MIKSFRGKLAPAQIKRIKLGTIRGEIGYTIKKFQLISTVPGESGKSVEYVGKLYSIEPPTADAAVNFDDPTLLGVVHLQDQHSADNPASQVIIFDNVKFNQDIYVTLADADGDTVEGNYYVELEQHRLSLNESTVATLKDMRGRE
jgi:hypothetical protein